MTIKTHVEAMQQLLLGLDTNWSSTDSKIKVAWLSMVSRLAGELEKLAQAEAQCLESAKEIKHGSISRQEKNRTTVLLNLILAN